MDSIKKIIITEPEIKKKSKSQLNELTKYKNIQSEKERKPKVDSYKWDLSINELSHSEQLRILDELILCNNNNTYNQNDNNSKKYFIKNIKCKIQSYKQQDLLKHKYDEDNFVSYNDVLILLKNSNMYCHYCHCETYVLYEFVKEMKQWSENIILQDFNDRTMIDSL